MGSWSFAKGHGTQNDFVIVADRHNMTPLTDEVVRALCDRRAGIGGDGLLRVVKARHIDGWDGDPEMWFMDYRNADGSIAEMCGNGLRVFVTYLYEMQLAPRQPVLVATRAGERLVTPLAEGQLAAQMGAVSLCGAPVQISCGSQQFIADEVDVGNPHAVVFLGPDDALDTLDLSRSPSWSPADRFPDGVNIEFVDVVDERHLRMRVFERGVGETRSCGTGTVAAAAAHSARCGHTGGQYRVDVPGGTLQVTLEDGQAVLAGPAVIVAHGTVLVP